MGIFQEGAFLFSEEKEFEGVKREWLVHEDLGEGFSAEKQKVFLITDWQNEHGFDRACVGHHTHFFTF